MEKTKGDKSLDNQDPTTFLSPWLFTDVVLVVEDTKFHVHKSTLSIWSPVFRAMFTSQFVESSAKEIPLPGKQADEIQVLLEVIYSREPKNNVNEENYQFLLEIAQEYQMDKVREFCLEELSDIVIEESNCLQIYKLCEQFGIENVRDDCLEMSKYMMSSNLQASQCYKDLKPEVKLDICMNRIKELEKTLQDYVTASSNLVQKVYQKIYKISVENSISIPKYLNIEDHISQHWQARRQRENELRKVALSKTAIKKTRLVLPNERTFHTFRYKCSSCIQRVDDSEWDANSTFNIGDLKGEFKKLYRLEQKNIVEELKKYQKKEEEEDDCEVFSD